MASWPDDTLALFRYSLIAPLLDPLADAEEKRRWRAEVVSRPHLLPDGRRVRVSAPTLRRWVRRYRLGGFEALRPALRRDRGSVRVVTPELLEQAKALKRQDPARSLPQVVRLLEAAGLVAPQSLKPNTLWRHLHREGLSQRLLPPKPGLRRFEAKAPNDLWQGDATPGPALPDPFQPGRMRRTYLLAFLDDHSRLVAHAEFFWAEDLYALELCFQQALLRRGLPWRVYVDRGLIFQAEVFTRACAELGIRHISGTPGHPEGRGKIERFFETLQDQFLRELSHHPVQHLAALNERLAAWIEEAYHVQVHSETGEAPAVRFARLETRRTVSAEKLAHVFLWRRVRRVDKTGCLRFDGNRYEAPPGLEGRKVQVRFHPLHLERLSLFIEGRHVGDAVALDLAHPVYRGLDRVHHPEPSRPVEPPIPYLELLVQRRRQRQARALSPLRLSLLEDPEAMPDV
ncbi:MAG: DDE-type integrase/transposase/recombinase [Firmicutes bacterium]|nr:DDE-type integrase/transposase/recombinase [Bacillota bacterium]